MAGKPHRGVARFVYLQIWLLAETQIERMSCRHAISNMSHPAATGGEDKKTKLLAFSYLLSVAQFFSGASQVCHGRSEIWTKKQNLWIFHPSSPWAASSTWHSEGPKSCTTILSNGTFSFLMLDLFPIPVEFLVQHFIRLTLARSHTHNHSLQPRFPRVTGQINTRHFQTQCQAG